MKPSPGQPLTVGFAGSRHLLPGGGTFSFETEALLCQAVETRLARILERLPEMLRQPWSQPIAGVSQIAIGADFHFTRACSRLGLPQRIFLPQASTDYLAAQSEDGTPDFGPDEREQALKLLQDTRIGEVRVVATSPDRNTRFVETNRAIVGASDVLLCQLRADAKGQPGGTLDLMEMARQAGKPVCELRLSLCHGNPVFRETLHRFPA